MLLNHINSLQEKTSILLNKLDKLKEINESLESQNINLAKVNKDLETKIKIIKAQEKQLKLVTAVNEDNSDKQYFKNKIDYLIKEIDYCIERISI
jgi:exonuclease VII small subunit|tara:strand:+ start:195 stop:479 length:285 start_codon:yes stop_codon:yes gene_type:complete